MWPDADCNLVSNPGGIRDCCSAPPCADSGAGGSAPALGSPQAELMLGSPRAALGGSWPCGAFGSSCVESPPACMGSPPAGVLTEAKKSREGSGGGGLAAGEECSTVGGLGGGWIVEGENDGVVGILCSARI